MRRHRNHNPRLARLFEFGMGKQIDWRNDELADILREQLVSPLLADLRPLASQLDSLGLKSMSSSNPPLNTFGDLLRHPHPTLSLLSLAKDFAKTADGRLEDPLPPAVASALYTSIIAAAIVRHESKITAMDDAELRAGLEWVQNQDWIDDFMRQLARSALGVLGFC